MRAKMDQPIDKIVSNSEINSLQNDYNSTPVNLFSSWGVKQDNQISPDQLQKLSQINKQLDEQLSHLKPFLQKEEFSNDFKFLQVNHDSNTQPILNMPNNSFSFPKINGFNSKSTDESLKFNFVSSDEKASSPLCIRREGMLKIRDVDQKDKDVVVTYAVLTKERLSYFVNSKDESSIQGSIELAKIKESLKLINGFPTCFTVKTMDGVSDCSVCAESEDSAREWINAVTQNAVNCNTMSQLSNLNKRGLIN